MSNPQAAPTLAQARATVDSLRSGYLTSTERALADLALSLAQELEVTRRDAMVASSVLASASAATVPLAALGGAASDDLRQEIEGLRAQLAAQRAATQQLNRDLEAIYLRNGVARSRRIEAPPLETAPRKHHTLEDFAANLPDFGESSGAAPSQSQAQALAHLSQPRVRAQDIQLTAEDIERNNQRRRPRLAGHQQLYQSTPTQTAGNVALLGVVVLVVFFLIVALGLFP
ncbi:MAG TPA: hypothetical protein VGE07_16205 [Herpetosiphonaceae bacterium]